MSLGKCASESQFVFSALRPHADFPGSLGLTPPRFPTMTAPLAYFVRYVTSASPQVQVAVT